MHLLLAAAAEFVPAEGDPSWLKFVYALFAFLGPLAIAYLGYLVQKQSKENKAIKEQVEAVAQTTIQVAETTEATSRKVTSNHGHDNIGDKVDTMVGQMAQIVPILPMLVELGTGNRAMIVKAVDRIEKLESVQVESVKQIADHTVANAVSLSQLSHTLEDTLGHMTVVEPTATIVPGPKRPQYCKKAVCDGNCGKRHSKRK